MRPAQISPIALALLAAALSTPNAQAQASLFGELHGMLPGDGHETEGVALGDLDGDGDLDALLAGKPAPRLYLNEGEGVFQDASAQLPTLPATPHSVALGDVDGDGDLDALLGYEILLLNDGAALFTDASVQLPVGFDTDRCAALADVDGDGDLDALVGTKGKDLLFFNDGAGVFMHFSGKLPGYTLDTRSIAVGDVDADGDLDLLLGTFGARLYRNDGAGKFSDWSSWLPSVQGDCGDVVLEDVDGDGDLDALLANDWGTVMLANDGTGHYSDVSSQLPGDTLFASALTAGDVDGDGDVDIVLGADSEPGRLYLNDGAGLFSDAGAQMPSNGDSMQAIALGDVDADGDLDGLIGNAFQNQLYLNDGVGGFRVGNPAIPWAVSGSTVAVALGDLDGDGDADVVIGNRLHQDELYLNDGTGLLVDATAQLPVAVNETQAVALGDVDADGDLDLVIGISSGQNALYLNDGLGVFHDATPQLPAVSDFTYSLALGDVDDDGDLDLFVGNAYSLSPAAHNELLLNDGAGVFSDATAQLPPAPYTPDSTEDVILADVDGDGDLDALLGNTEVCFHDWCSGAQQSRLLLNDGAGVFSDATAQLPVDLDWTIDLALGDVDGDGDPDLLLVNAPSCPGKADCTGGVDRLFLNDGSGVFSDASAQLPVEGEQPNRAASFGDVDGDGDLDVLVTRDGSTFWSIEGNVLYLNDGSGSFAVSPGQVPWYDDQGSAANALVDLDGDGDLDAFLGVDWGQNRVATNLTRQLAWRGIPRVGKELTLDLYGSAASPWFLAWSTGAASIALPPFGTLRLDPVGLKVAGSGALDGLGRAAVAFDVSGDPALVGLLLHWQALLGAPLAFTNRETTTLTDL